MAFAKEKLTTAIDISGGLIKIAAVSDNKDGGTLCVLDSAPASSDNDKDLSKAIRSLIAKNHLGKSQVLVSFPRHLVTIRDVRLPTTHEEEIRDMAELQAVKYLPYSREDMEVAYQTVDTTRDGYTDILLTLAQSKSVRRYLEIFKNAGVAIERIALSSEGLYKWYLRLKLDDSQPVAVIDLGRHHTQILIAKDKKLFFSRSVSFDTVDPDSDRNILLREIRLSFDSYLKDRDERVSRVIITGREAYSKQFADFFANNFSVPSGQSGQLCDIKAKDTAERSSGQLGEASFASLLGIALNPENLSINLLPRHIIDKKKELALKNELIKSAILLLSVIVAGFGIMEKKVSEKRHYLKKMEKRLKEIEPDVKRLSKMKENVELIRAQLMFKGSSIDVLRELYKALPQDISLTLLEFEDKNRVLLRGSARELSGVFNLLPLLEKSQYFENVKINYATKRTFRNTEFADFEIICTLTYFK